MATLLLLPASAIAAPGDRDPGWGRHGVSAAVQGLGYSDAATADGGVLVFTRSDLSGAVTKLSASGRLDGSFGNRGSVSTPSSLWPDRMGATPDGGFLVAGSQTSSGASGRSGTLEVVKYTAGGAPDTAFGSGGVATFTPPATYTLVNDVQVAPNGDIGLLVGNGATGGIVQLKSDGSPRASFGAGGFSAATLQDLDALARDSQGRYLIGGSVKSGTYSVSPQVARYLPDGSLDTSFGSGGGVVFDDRGDVAGVPDLDVDTSGRILVNTFSNHLSSKGTGIRRLVRLEPDGSINGSFAPADVPGVLTGDLAIDDAGRLLLTGATVGDYGSNRSDPTVIRLLPDGSLDPAFGKGGVVVMRQLDVGASGLSQPLIGADGSVTSLAGAYDLLTGAGSTSTIRLLGAPGPPDSDADGIRDRRDRCPTSAGDRRTGGCPLLERKVTIGYRPDDSLFTGEVEGPRGCLRNAAIRLLRVKAGRDEIVGRTHAQETTWEIAGSFHRGLYYAVTPRRLDGEFGICTRTRSRKIEVEPY